jgi:hypothetical protein
VERKEGGGTVEGKATGQCRGRRQRDSGEEGGGETIEGKAGNANFSVLGRSPFSFIKITNKFGYRKPLTMPEWREKRREGRWRGLGRAFVRSVTEEGRALGTCRRLGTSGLPPSPRLRRGRQQAEVGGQMSRLRQGCGGQADWRDELACQPKL